MFRMPRTGSPWREPPTVIESLSFERGTLDRHPHAFLLPNARVQEATARSLLWGREMQGFTLVQLFLPAILFRLNPQRHGPVGGSDYCRPCRDADGALVCYTNGNYSRPLRIWVSSRRQSSVKSVRDASWAPVWVRSSYVAS